VTQIGDGVDDDMKVNLRVRIMRATNLPSKDAASKITGAYGSCDCYVKVNVANEELFVNVTNITAKQTSFCKVINAGQARCQTIHQ